MKKITIAIPDALYKNLKEAFKHSGLSSFEDFLLSVIQQSLDQSPKETDSDAEEEIRKRLENLGYM